MADNHVILMNKFSNPSPSAKNLSHMRLVYWQCTMWNANYGLCRYNTDSRPHTYILHCPHDVIIHVPEEPNYQATCKTFQV